MQFLAWKCKLHIQKVHENLFNLMRGSSYAKLVADGSSSDRSFDENEWFGSFTLHVVRGEKCPHFEKKNKHSLLTVPSFYLRVQRFNLTIGIENDIFIAESQLYIV